MKILEIGSGSLEFHVFLKGENITHVDICKNAYCLENLCDCHKLPFKDNSFDIVYIAHVLEHCYNPVSVIKEIKRVSKLKVVISIPNCDFYKNISECKEHIYSWNENTLNNLLLLYFDKVKIKSCFKVREYKSKVKKVLSYMFYIFLRRLIKCNNDLIAECEKI